MGSVIDYIECPNCSHEAYNDYYYKTGEEYTMCNNCGYNYSAQIINRDKPLDELTDEDWKIDELKNPYGSYRIRVKNDVGFQCGSLPNEQSFEDLKTSIEEVILNGTEVEYFAVSAFINGEIVVNELINNKTPEISTAPEIDNELPF